MPTKEEMLEVIQKKVWRTRNVWNEYEWDFFTEEIMIWDVLELLDKKDYENAECWCPECDSYDVCWDTNVCTWCDCVWDEVYSSYVFECDECGNTERRDHRQEAWEIDLYCIVQSWKHKRLPINDQDINCIEYIYDLFSKNHSDPACTDFTCTDVIF